MSEYFNPIYSTDNIWRGQNPEQCLTDDLDSIESDITTLQTGKANSNHTHTGYATTTDLEQLETLIGNSSVSSQISTAISTKADINHSHAISNITGLADELDSKYEKPSTGIPKSDLSLDVQASLAKADTALQSVSGFATESYVNTQISTLVDSAPATLNTLNELASALGDDPNFATTIATQIGNKVDSVDGKGLSTNDYTTAEKTKLSGIETGAEVNQNAFSNVIVGSTTIAADNKTDTLTFVAGSNITITPDVTNDQITISATDTVYTHPSYTAKSSGLYKTTIDGTGHVSAATAVSKSDITALGIPSQDTTYSEATASAAGLLSASDKAKLDGIETDANKTIVDSALSDTSTNPVQNKVINVAINNLSTQVSGKADSSHTHSGYALLTAGNEFNGEQKLVNSQYCPSVTDTANGIGCAFKASRGLFNEVLIDNLFMTSYTGQIPIYTYSGTTGGSMSGTTKVGYIDSSGNASFIGAVSGSNLADTVIEQGSSGNLYYQKWSSGKSEAWYSESLGTVEMTSALANNVWSNTSCNARGVTLPSGLFSVAPTATCNAYSNGYTFSQVSSASTTQVVYRVWSPYSTTISGCVVSIHIIGRWK